MTGPIIAGEHPRREALFIVALIALILVLGTPELSARALGKFPWLAPVFGWLQQHRWLEGLAWASCLMGLLYLFGLKLPREQHKTPEQEDAKKRHREE